MMNEEIFDFVYLDIPAQLMVVSGILLLLSSTTISRTVHKLIFQRAICRVSSNALCLGCCH